MAGNIVQRDKATVQDALVVSSGEDSKKLANPTKVIRVLFAVCTVGLLVLLFSSRAESRQDDAVLQGSMKKKGLKTVKQSGPPAPMASYRDFSAAITKYDSCVVSWTPPPPKDTWDTKPLWLPSHPGSGGASVAHLGDIMKPLVNGITGLQAGAKMWHAQSKSLKRCKGLDETATCAQSHPMVSASPESQADNFDRNVIMLIRNIRTAWPQSYYDKHIAYHNGKGQPAESDWRSIRDEWGKGAFGGWKSVVTTWKQMREYDVALYVQYEALMDPERGPAELQRIADLLQQSGFSVAPKEDVPCIWYKVIKDEYTRLQDFFKYEAGYTAELRDFYLTNLTQWQQEVADDKELSRILGEYFEDLRDNTYIDIPYNISG